MLRLATEPLPTFESTENELYGVSASNPITIDDSDTDDSDVVYIKETGKEPEEDSVESGDDPIMVANQVNH